MAKIYSAPKGFEAPETDFDNWQTQEKAYLERLAAEARRNTPNNDLVGEVVRFPMADSHAEYMVWSTKPLALIHLAIGDAWQIPAAHARGLNVSDIRQNVELARRWTALFAEKRAAQESGVSP